MRTPTFFFVFFFNDTATTEIYTLSLHDALPISPTSTAPPPGATAVRDHCANGPVARTSRTRRRGSNRPASPGRSEEHTSELQSQSNLVCRLLLEKKKTAIDAARPSCAKLTTIAA